jgi:hypothetical protein
MVADWRSRAWGDLMMLNDHVLRSAKVYVYYLRLSVGVGQGNRGPLVPQGRALDSLDEAKHLAIPDGFIPWIQASDGYHVYAAGHWQVRPFR